MILFRKYLNNSTAKHTISNYILVFLLIGVSGIPYLMEKPFLFGVHWLNILTLLFLYSGYKFQKISKIDYYYLLIILILTIITIGQSLLFNDFEFELALSIIIRFSIPYFIIIISKGKFLDYYIKILYYFAILSLILFIPSQFSTVFNDLVRGIATTLNLDSFEHRKSFIIYTIDSEHNRNAGPFWEAGAFCAFLLLALIFILIKYKTFKNKEGYIFIVSILTTSSTAGYLALFFLFLGYYAFIINIRHKIIYISILLIIFVYAFTTQEFLQEKINNQLSTQINAVDRIQNLGRFQSAILDFVDISESPYFGRGRGENRYNKNELFIEYGAARRSNGLTDFVAKQGIPFSILFFILLYKSIKKTNVHFKAPQAITLISFFTLIIIVFSQLLFTSPLFAGLIYLFLPYNKINAGVKNVSK